MNRLRTFGRTAYLLAVYGFIYLPVAALVLFSFQGGALSVPPFNGPSLRWYRALFSDGRMVDALGNSLMVGAVSATVATLLGFLAAYALARHRPLGARLLRGYLMAPLAVSYLVIALGLSFGLNELGITRSLAVVVIGHVVINLPLAFAIILSQLHEGQANIEKAARDLGAGEATVLTRITLPLLAPGTLAAFLLSFTLSWDEFIIALLVTRFDVTLPVEIWSALRTGLDPKTNAAGTAVFALSVGMLVLSYGFVFRRLERDR